MRLVITCENHFYAGWLHGFAGGVSPDALQNATPAQRLSFREGYETYADTPQKDCGGVLRELISQGYIVSGTQEGK